MHACPAPPNPAMPAMPAMPASGSDSELAHEITRIASCPYAPSLVKLARFLALADGPSIRACVLEQPPCAIAKLASIVLDALSSWRCALAVLQALSHSLEFRQELLLQNPGLLDALLTKANASQQDFDQYAGLCIALLSHRLPHGVLLPASAQSFFLRVFEHASDGPDVQTLKPVYCMLNGACQGLIELLPLDVRELFDKKLCQILSSNSLGKNAMPLLWCFGIVILAEHPELVGKSDASSDFSTVEWATSSGRKIFGTASGCLKTVTLACLTVIWATKGGVGVSDDEAVEGIRIAVRTLQLIDQQLLEQWHSSDSSGMVKNLIPKLLEKIQRSGINPAVQLEALHFLAMILGSKQPHQDVVALYAAALTNLAHLGDANSFGESIALSFPIFAPRMHETSVQSLLSHLLQSSISPTSTDQMQKMKALAHELTGVVPKCEPLRKHIFTALSAPDMQNSIQSFLHMSFQAYDDKHPSICLKHKMKLFHDLVSATSSMLLVVMLSVGSNSNSLSPSLGMGLIKLLQQQQPAMSNQCHHTSVTKKPPVVSFFEQECTPISGLPLQDWRERLTSELESQAFYQRDSLVRSVAQICQDLERRCETVEEPLRQEREKSGFLESELAQLRKDKDILEQKRVDDNLFLDALDAEKTRLERDNDELSSRLEQLRQDLAEANRQADRALHEVEEIYSGKEMQLQSVIIAHEETIQFLREETDNSHQRANTLADMLKREQQEKRELGDRHERLETQYQEAEIELRKERHTLAQNIAEVNRLANSCDDLQHRLRGVEKDLVEEKQSQSRQIEKIGKLQEEASRLQDSSRAALDALATATEQLNNLQSRHHELAQSSTKALQNAEAQYKIDLEAAASKAAEERDRLHADLQEVLDKHEQLNDAYEEAQQDLSRTQTSLISLNARLQDLTNECSAKDTQLEELKSWRNRVFTSMGLPPESGPARSHEDDPRNLHQHRHRKSAVQIEENFKAPIVTQSISNTAMEHVANASFNSSNSHSSQTGSTPKRQKPRPSFKIPTMHTPYGNKPALAPKATSRKLTLSGRSALRSISPNRRHTTVGFAVPKPDEDRTGKQTLPLRNRRGSLQEAERTDFDMDDFLTGTPSLTPGEFISSTERMPEEGQSTTEL